MTLVRALLVEDRALKGLSPVPLFAADPAHVALDPVIDGAETLSGHELCRRVMGALTLTEDMQQRWARGVAPRRMVSRSLRPALSSRTSSAWTHRPRSGPTAPREGRDARN